MILVKALTVVTDGRVTPLVIISEMVENLTGNLRSLMCESPCVFKMKYVE